MPNYLPPDEMFADYASGASSPGLSLLMAAHLTQAPESREKLRVFEDVGGAMLADEDMAEMSLGALESVMARLDSADGSAQIRVDLSDGGPLPRPVLEHVGVQFDEIPWRFRLPGVASYDLDGFEGETVQLLRARPGAAVPQHTHKGFEITLVMQGALMDDGVAYRKGDVAVNDEHDDHRPRATGTETCYCLIVQQGDLHFTGRFSRMLNLLGE